MRIGLDATPLLGRRTGIGRYTDSLLRELAREPGTDEIVATAFTVRGAPRLGDAVPTGVQVRSRRMPARLLRALWQRAEFPPVSWSAGPLDVFHATNFVLPPVGRAAGVVTVHDLSFLHLPEAVDSASLAYRHLVPRSLERAEIVLTPSRTVAHALVAEYGTDPARVRAVPLGVDESWMSQERPGSAWLAARGLPEDYVVAVGTLEPRKNLQCLVDAFELLMAGNSHGPHLVLVGPEGWGAALHLDRLPRDRVHLTGFLEDEDLRRVVAGSRGLAFPSRYEGFGLPPLEALACGRPAVVSDLPVMHEVLGDLATYVPVGGAAALAAALDGLPGPGESEEAAAVRRRHAARYTWRGCADQTREAYRAALDSGRERRGRVR